MPRPADSRNWAKARPLSAHRKVLGTRITRRSPTMADTGTGAGGQRGLLQEIDESSMMGTVLVQTSPHTTTLPASTLHEVSNARSTERVQPTPVATSATTPGTPMILSPIAARANSKAPPVATTLAYDQLRPEWPPATNTGFPDDTGPIASARLSLSINTPGRTSDCARCLASQDQ
jgi:hypothetical protein